MEKKRKKPAVFTPGAGASSEKLQALLREGRRRGYKSVLVGEMEEDLGADLTLSLRGSAPFTAPALAGFLSDYDLILDKTGLLAGEPLSEKEQSDAQALFDRLDGGEPIEEPAFLSEIKLVLRKGEDRFGPGGYELLCRVGKTGSIQAAAREMGLSYSKALKLVKMAEHFCPEGPFLLRSRGGEGGGRSILTKEGSAFLSSYAAMRSELAALSEGVKRKYFS